MNTPFFVAKTFILLAVSAALLGATPLAVAAETSAVATETAKTAAAPPRSGGVTVKKGDTLLRIIARHLDYLPFKLAIVRTAVMQKNPAAFKDGKPEGMVTGAVLQLPTMEDFRRMLASLEAVSEDAHAELESDPRRGWVRFP